MATLASDAPGQGALRGDGPSKSLVLCFKSSKLPMGSLRLIPQETWSSIMTCIGRGIRSRVDSTPVEKGLLLAGLEKSKSRKVSTKGLTSYLLSDASLCLSDTTVTLKTHGGAPPLGAMETILDHAVPAWREKKCPENYLKFVAFTSTGYGNSEGLVQSCKTWAEEVEYLTKYFDCGEEMALGSNADEKQHIFIANYLNKDEISDVFSTRVCLRGLDPTECMKRFGGKDELVDGSQSGPLQLAWASIHGEEGRSIAANVQIDESYEPNGYAANGVFSQHLTAAYACIEPRGPYISVETTLPLTKQAKLRFALGVEGMCHASQISFTEFALSPTLFLRGPPPEIPNFTLLRSSESVGKSFACATHHYTRIPAGARWSSCLPKQVQLPEATSELPSAVVVADITEAPVRAAELYIQSLEPRARGGGKDLPVALLDLSQVQRQAEHWRRLLPRVEPFYAVKCNGFLPLVQTLLDVWGQWGTGGFDCASIAEMELVTGLQVDPRRQIVFANPCKQPSSVAFARSVGVTRVVFDNAAELDKIKGLHPEAELLLRVQTDDTLARCPLSNKFGAAVEECGKLLERAQQLELEVVGVSFHVGSGCSQLGAFHSALHRARAVFDEAARLGLSFTVLDIGGGFPGFDEDGSATFADHAADICSVLEELFPSPDLQVIAEPGRFFAASSQALLTSVISVAESSQGFRYYLNDGLYGSFNSVVYDHARVPEPVILRDGKELLDSDKGPLCACTIFGPTCDGFDLITDTMPLPKLKAGDRLLFKCMGAYTSAASTSFNGFAPAAPITYRSRTE